MANRNMAPIEKNREYEVDIIDNGFEGEGIAKIENFIVFIPRAIKGEKCKILIVKVNKNFAFGKLLLNLARKEVVKRISNPTIIKKIPIVSKIILHLLYPFHVCVNGS